MHRAELIEELGKRVRELEILISKMDLNRCSVEGTIQAYGGRLIQHLPNNGRVYLGKDSMDKIHALCEKRYHNRLRKAAEYERGRLERCLDILAKKERTWFDEVYSSLPDEIRKHVEPDCISDDGFIRKWMGTNWARWRLPTDRYQLKTHQGERVRSKSELIIANELSYRKIPYVYEVEILLDEWTMEKVHPDFMVMNRRTLQVFLWEHCGRMDDPKYRKRNVVEKMALYARYGYFPGLNMILTFEDGPDTFDTDYIGKTIDGYLC